MQACRCSSDEGSSFLKRLGTSGEVLYDAFQASSQCEIEVLQRLEKTRAFAKDYSVCNHVYEAVLLGTGFNYLQVDKRLILGDVAKLILLRINKVENKESFLKRFCYASQKKVFFLKFDYDQIEDNIKSSTLLSVSEKIML